MAMRSQVDYYRHPAVRRHVAQFVGKSAYIVGYGESEFWRGNSQGYYSAPLSGLGRMFRYGLDILMCMQNREATIGLLDIEYYNPRYPGEAHLNPGRVFHLLEPMYGRIMGVFRRYGIPVVADITGQGYHFWCRFPFGPRHRALESLGWVEPSLARAYARRRVSREVAFGFSGMGRIMTFLASEIFRESSAARRSGARELPSYFSDIHPPFGRDAISIDLTSYADPVFMRDVRVPFSTYQKHRVVVDKVGQANSQRIPIEILVPRAVPGHAELGLDDALRLRRNFDEAAQWADRVNPELPDASEGMLRLLEAYSRSRVGVFFHFFDRGPATLPRIPMRRLPPCIRHALNPWQLLEPTQAQAVVRVLDKMGVHPKQIAELFYRKYRRTPFGHYNPQRRAYFWVQSYAALIHAGIDTKSDLTCLKHQQRDRCVKPMCGWDLSKYR